MFSYYGGKGRVAGRYPPPKYDLVIEPFAGAAWYSCKYQLGKDALLFDVDNNVATTWDWILNRATPDDLLYMSPHIPGKRMTGTYEDPGKDLYYRWWGNQGSNSPRNVAGTWKSISQTSFSTIHIKRLLGVKSWKFQQKSYENAPNIEATWFIDPPYCQQNRYKHNSIDYTALSKWCLSRQGQVIVCEAGSANWLPFKKLGIAPGSSNTSKLKDELIWINK